MVWDDSACAAAEALLPMVCDWCVGRQPWRYKRDPDGQALHFTIYFTFIQLNCTKPVNPEPTEGIPLH